MIDGDFYNRHVYNPSTFSNRFDQDTGGVIFDDVTPEWQDFCHTTLGFEIPEDLRYAYEQNAETEKTEAEPETVQSKAAL